MLTVAALASVITTHRPVVEEALGFLGGGTTDYHLDAIEVQAALRGLDTASMLLALLQQMQQVEAFVAMLRARRITLAAEDDAPFTAPGAAAETAADGVFGQVSEGGFDLAALGQFAFRAKAFRCRILIDGTAVGSGAFVAPRLVLTAAHVLESLVPGQRLEVLAEDGQRYAARLVWHSPCHPDEYRGALPPAIAADTHVDAALLKLLHPVGRRLAEIALPDTLDPHWTGTRHLFLVHFPLGEDTGGATGRVLRNAGDLRLVHNITTDPGSSGAPGFDRQLRFVGLHQGRLHGGNNRRLVPFDRFAAIPVFRTEIDADRNLRSLWSLDGSPDGHIVLGRGLFLDAVRAIALRELPMLAGIWVRRSNLSAVTGLSFSHSILSASLRALGQEADVTLVPTDHATSDLIATIEGLVSPGTDDEPPASGAADTITPNADADRATALMDRLGARAAEGRPQWLFFENPPEGLAPRALLQLEQLVRLSLHVQGVQVVLAGFETYGLVDTRFESTDDALTSTRPGLLVEILGDTPVADICATLAEACHDTGLNWTPDIIRHEVDRALVGLPQPGGRLSPEHLGTVAQRLSETLRERLAA
jgi:hypothetical protein